MFKNGLTAVAVILLTLAFVVLLALFAFGMDSFFRPKYAALDRQVFKESAAYNEGMLRDLENLQLQYAAASPEQKVALRALIKHRFEVYDENKLPADLRNFYEEIK